MNLTSFIACRYLLASQSSRFFSWISALCVTGIAIGVAAMIVVLSVINGFQDELRNRFLSANAHIMIYRFPEGLKSPDIWRRGISENFGTYITGSAPFVHFETMGRKDYLIHSMLVRGISPDLRESVQKLDNMISPPSAMDQLQTEINDVAEGKPLPEVPSIILGKGLASVMQAQPGDDVQLISPGSGPDDLMGELRRFHLVGLYDSGLQHYDDKLALLSIPAAQQLFNLKNIVTGIEIGLKNPDKSPEIASLISEQFPEVTVKQWQAFNKNVFEAMQNERKVIGLIVALVAFVASFNILTTLFVSVTQKQRDIALLKALGANNRQILMIFVKQSLFIGMAGGFAGLILAFVFARILEQTPFIKLPDIYLLSTLPVSYDWRVYTGVSIAGLVIAILAGLYPALRATRVTPVRGLTDSR
ncbi:MAG: FtsX-like permease family protein [Deltaproteobacteria bacterium]|nr:FtsX-like permease family protein [Deltaproteobacteria bacterium]